MNRENRKRPASIFIALVLMNSAFALPPPLVPRKSPEFTISEPSGKTILLSSFKGRVVVLEFLFIQSEHCMRVAQILNKLNGELGARGFQAVGIVFDPPKVPTSGERLIPSIVDFFKLTYPVGFASKTDVDTYLGRTRDEILNIPQVVVIDRGGMIRAVSGARGGDTRLEDETYLRGLIELLLKEQATVGKKSRVPTTYTK